MSQIPSIAIVLEGGLVQDVIVQDWPEFISPPAIVIVDYDTDGMNEDELTRFAIGSAPADAFCHREIPVIYETRATALSPRAVLDALNADSDRPS